jgi:hypothetical protein
VGIQRAFEVVIEGNTAAGCSKHDEEKGETNPKVSMDPYKDIFGSR